jgi:TolB-like protein
MAQDLHRSKDSRLAPTFKWALVSLCQVLSALLCAGLAEAGDYERLAGELARAARARGAKRVAVLPFQGVGAKDGKAGRLVAERLVAPLSNEPGLEIVERTLLESVLSEQRLQGSGIVDARALRELGRLLDADAVIAGAVASLKDDRAEIYARLIDAESGRVLGAATAKVEKDWPEHFMDDAPTWGAALPPLPSFEVPLPKGWNPRDAVAGIGCTSARERIEETEKELTELKARYWAQRLRDGLPARSLKRNPGSEIEDQGLRRKFYAALRRETDSPSPDLRSDEIELLRIGLSRIERLSKDCAPEVTWAR